MAITGKSRVVQCDPNNDCTVYVKGERIKVNNNVDGLSHHYEYGGMYL